ncbi:unnamed protein product, partial [Fusarium fujikuroi]
RCRLAPGLSAADLPLKMTNDQWAFTAPRQVTRVWWLEHL